MAQKDKLIEDGFGLVNMVAIFALILLVGVFGNYLGKSLEKPQAVNQQVIAAQAISYDGQDGKTALELLKTRATIETQDFSVGIYVTSINGVQNSQDHYWMFYLNGELSSVGADQYVTKSSDKIEWRYNQI